MSDPRGPGYRRLRSMQPRDRRPAGGRWLLDRPPARSGTSRCTLQPWDAVPGPCAGERSFRGRGPRSDARRSLSGDAGGAILLWALEWP